MVEMKLLLGPVKGKDFDNALGPIISISLNIKIKNNNCCNQQYN
ncbi:hypothetical protein SACC_26980 [Saccharolobus caldissimus]|uniref:Uncharacterized protein n=1 Tax=Saccharolobus caldissimus TaxID=1702097 RepID=A0AAQ4CV50_9CREN|nr:hypothetical protein SACC_26980 [Saccharolobus caldissimus]